MDSLLQYIVYSHFAVSYWPTAEWTNHDNVSLMHCYNVIWIHIVLSYLFTTAVYVLLLLHHHRYNNRFLLKLYLCLCVKTEIKDGFWISRRLRKCFDYIIQITPSIVTTLASLVVKNETKKLFCCSKHTLWKCL